MQDHDGGCLCGAIRFRTSSVPHRVTVCHCRFCQRATGSAYLVEPIFLRSSFSITKGEPQVYDHRSKGSGKLIYIHFCGRCGTKTHQRFERFPDIVGVFGGTFDDPNWFDRAGETAKHIFLDDAQIDTLIPSHIKTYRQHATALSGVPNEPKIYDRPRRADECD